MRVLQLPVLLGAALLALSCSYAPDFGGGVLACSAAMTCPKGYSCASDGACWKDGMGPTDADPLAKYVGIWTFESGNLDSQCSDGTPTTMALSGQTVPVTKQGSSGLLATYYCGWVLHRGSASLAAVADAGQSCQQVVPGSGTDATFTYTWHGDAFSFSTMDGETGMVTGHVEGPFSGSDGSTGTCDGKFSGSLTKTSP
jgi:hypothetical protein